MYNLKFNQEQAQIIIRALDLYARIGIGQFESILDVYDRPCNLDLKERDGIREGLRHAKLCAGHPENGSFGIHNSKVRDEFRAAFDIQQVIRHRVAHDRSPEGGNQIDFDTPYRISSQPLPEIESK